MSVGNRMGTSSTQDMVLLAVLAVGAYVLYKVFGAVSAVGSGISAVAGAAKEGYTATVDAVSSGLYAVFGPNDAKALGSMDFLLVNFPDGSRHAVPADSVTGTGLFTWTGYPAGSQPGITLQLVKDKSGSWYATQES